MLLFLWAGLLTGLAESLLLLFKRYIRHRFIMVGDDTLWMAPLAEGIVFVLVGFSIVLMTRAARPVIRNRSVSAVLTGLATVCLLVLWGRLEWYAVGLVGIGIALRVGSWMSRRLDAVLVLSRRTLPALVICLMLIPSAMAAVRWWHERLSASEGIGGTSPNVLLIILDTVRSHNLSLYGYGTRTTPGLERWAGQGTVFEHAFSPSSWTLPSHATMFTGHWPTELTVSFRTPLDNTFPTLAEELTADGYATGGFAANLIYTTRETGLARGFTHYEDYGVTWGEFFRSSVLLRKVLDHSRYKWVTRRWRPASWRSADDVSHEALHWIGTRGNRPWFAFLNYIEAHDPWFVPAPFDTLFGVGARGLTWQDITTTPLPDSAALHHFEVAYDGALAYLDSRVTALLDTLELQHRLENTIIIVTADHGEEIGEHGAFGHGQSLYRPVVEVPLIVITPDCRMGYRLAGPVSLRDLPATVADLVHLSHSPFPGHSFAGQLCGAPLPGESRPVFSVLKETRPPAAGPLVSVVADTLRYIGSRGGIGELYDFSHDPWERNNLAQSPSGSALTARYRALVDSLLRASAPDAATRAGAHDVQSQRAITQKSVRH
ncbi:MAG: sulfatase [Gemmatimonadota bacterium]